jgi:hypothetical protein
MQNKFLQKILKNSKLSMVGSSATDCGFSGPEYYFINLKVGRQSSQGLAKVSEKKVTF